MPIIHKKLRKGDYKFKASLDNLMRRSQNKNYKSGQRCGSVAECQQSQSRDECLLLGEKMDELHQAL